MFAPEIISVVWITLWMLQGDTDTRKRRWQHHVLYFGICGVSPSWKAADWSLSELVGTTPLPEGCSPPRGVERILPISPGEREGTEPSWALPRFGFPSPRGELRSLREELLVCSCPSITHSLCSPCPSCGVCEALRDPVINLFPV